MVYKFSRRLARQLQKYCLLCHQSITSYQAPYGLCSHCYEDLPHNHHACSRCALPLNNSSSALCGKCLSKQPHYDACYAPLRYESDCLRLISHLKQSFHRGIARTAGELITAYTPIENIDLLTCVPLHWHQELKRGNNHAKLIMNHIRYEKHRIPSKQVLTSKPKTQAQKHLNKQSRQQNLSGIFSCQYPLDGLTIAVVDDVMTTGATMNEVAKTLKAAGAEKVVGLALARTP